MMAGAYRMALSRAKVLITAPGGSPVEHDQVTASVRDGVAQIRNGAVVETMPVAELQRRSSRDWTIIGADGTTWLVTKPCNCGGGR